MSFPDHNKSNNEQMQHEFFAVKICSFWMSQFYTGKINKEKMLSSMKTLFFLFDDWNAVTEFKFIQVTQLQQTHDQKKQKKTFSSWTTVKVIKTYNTPSIKNRSVSERQIESAEATIFGKAKFWIIWGSDNVLGLSYLN